MNGLYFDVASQSDTNNEPNKALRIVCLAPSEQRSISNALFEQACQARIVKTDLFTGDVVVHLVPVLKDVMQDCTAAKPRRLNREFAASGMAPIE